MRKTSIRKFLVLLAACCLPALMAGAQTVKTIAVSGDASYTDHLSLAEDSRDMDIMVKFIFDEPKNMLTVSVLSYRRLFVFRESARYSSVVRCRSLRPDLLPYVAESDPQLRFKLSKALRKSIPCPRRDYVFRRWIEYEGLQPVPSEYRMVNDYIEQSFEILQKRNAVTVTLRDLFLLERSGKNPDLYTLLKGRDLNMKYQIQLLRNPCLGKEEEIAAARALCEDVKAAWQTFRKTYEGGVVSNEEALKTFEETRTLLLTQFPPRQVTTACPDLMQATRQFNEYVDSIGSFTCKVRPEDAAPAWDLDKGLDTKTIYAQARLLDKSVARYLVSKDPLEREDLVTQCREIVADVSAMIQRHRPVTAAELKAVKVYRQAEQYFKKTCKQ